MATSSSNPPSNSTLNAAGPSSRGPNSKLYIRMQNVARYRISGRFSDVRVAEMVGLTQSGLAALIKNPDYIEIENALLEGRLSKIDEDLAHDREAKEEVMRRAVPAALTFLVEGVLQRRDLRTALACAKTIIENDPDNTFKDAKVNERGNGNGNGGSAENAPTLPGDIVASLAVAGNKVITEIKTSTNKDGSTTTTVETKLPEAKGNA